MIGVITSGRARHARPLDPAPRSYASTITLLRRGSFDHTPLIPQTPAQIEAWLLENALAESDLLELYQEFIWRMAAADLPVVRSSLHVGTLHPQLYGYAWNWNSDDGFCDEVVVDRKTLVSDAYRRNPLFRVVEFGERLRIRLDTAARDDLGPLLRELADQGLTDYAALPLRAGGANHNAATVATRQPGGFTGPEFRHIARLLRIFALHVERHIAEQISRNIVTTYLGKDAGRQVLEGSIRRGSGAAIDAVIWASDLRGFTQLADRLTDSQLTAVLDAYFDCLAGAVIDHGGDVLKFIGDGLLAVFPFTAFPGEAAAADAAIAAARAAIAALDRMNADPEALGGAPSWRPLRTGIALHRGEVFFGNVGAPARLDFTVIGKAVNAVSRIEGLCKTTGQSVLASKPVASIATVSMQSLGEFELRGLEHPIELYAFP